MPAPANITSRPTDPTDAAAALATEAPVAKLPPIMGGPGPALTIHGRPTTTAEKTETIAHETSPPNSGPAAPKATTQQGDCADQEQLPIPLSEPPSKAPPPHRLQRANAPTNPATATSKPPPKTSDPVHILGTPATKNTR